MKTKISIVILLLNVNLNKYARSAVTRSPGRLIFVVVSGHLLARNRTGSLRLEPLVLTYATRSSTSR